MERGLFSKSLLDIEIQLDDLITKAGGISGVKLLDRLASMPESLRNSAIEHFLEILDGDWDEDKEEASLSPDNIKKGHLSVLDGGLTKTLNRKAG
jgi:hypothetical protein